MLQKVGRIWSYHLQGLLLFFIALHVSSNLSIVLLSRQPFWGLRLIQSGPAVGRLVVSERSFLFWWKTCSVKLVRLNSKYSVSQLRFHCLCCILQFSQAVVDIVWELCCCSLWDEIQGKCKEKTKHLNFLSFPFLLLTTEVEDIWVLIVESKKFSLLRLEST